MTPPDSESRARPGRVGGGAWLGLGGTLVAAALLLAPVLGAPSTRLLGRFQSETATHAPALAAAVEGLLTNGPFVLADHPLHPNDITGAMYEPITTIVMAPIYALAGGGATGFALAWNAWHLAVLLGTAAGAWIWARAWLGETRDPGGWGAGLAAVVAAGSLFLHLSPEVGRTEATNYSLFALHGGLLFRAARQGGRAWIAAALSVVPVVWAGGYATVFWSVVEPGVALWALAVTPDRRGTARGLAAVAGAGLLAVAPMAWALHQHPYIALTGRETTPSVAISVLFGGAENALRELPGYEIAPFVGWVTLGVAALAALRVRSALWPLAIGLFVYAVSAGPAPTVGDTILRGPAALFAVLPAPYGLIRGWSRIVAFAVPLFAVAAAVLPGALGGTGALWRPITAGALALLALAETACLRETPGSSWALAEPAALVSLHAAGQKPIRLPMDGLERARRWLEPQPPPDVWVAMPDHELFRYFQDAMPNEPELFRVGGKPAVTYDPCALQADAVALRAVGFTALYLRDELLPEDGHGIGVRALKAVFGPAREPGVWPLPTEVSEACAGTPDVVPPPPIVAGLDKGARSAEGESAEDGAPGDTLDRGGPVSPAERAALRALRQAEREQAQIDRMRRKNGGR